MELNDCFLLGDIEKPNGFKGAVNAFLDVDDPSKYNRLGKVFLEISGQLIEYPVNSIEIRHKNMAVLKFEGVDSEEEAESLTGLQMYLPLTELPPLGGNKFYFHEVVGFSVHDQQHGDVGKITRVLDMPQQAILDVMHDGKQILIPVTDEIILNVDRENKTVDVKTPEGLIDLYLQ